MMSSQVNIKDLPATTEIKSGDLLILETSQGTELLDFNNFIITEYHTTFFPVVSSNSDKIDVNATNILALSSTLHESAIKIGTTSVTVSGLGVDKHSPKLPLQVNDYGGLDGNANELIIRNNAYWDADEVQNERMVDGYVTQIEMLNNTGSIRFSTADSSTAGSSIDFVERVSILNNGRVGIGTPEPTYMLDVSASNNTSPTLRIKTSVSDGSPALRIESGDHKYSLKIDGDNTDALTIRDETNNTSRIIMNTIGDVGLGTNPHTVLHVGSVSACATFEPHISTPPDPTVSSEGRMYITDGNFVIQYNDNATVRYKFIDLTGTSDVWYHSITPPVAGSSYSGSLHDEISLLEKTADPTEPAATRCVIWLSNGDGKGDDGDLMIASNVDGTTKYGTLFDHSAGSAW